MRFFPDFLVAPLQRAITLAQMHRPATAVAQHLDFDVTRFLQVFLDIDIAIAEGRLGFGLGGAHGDLEIVLALRHLHAAATAAGGGLDDDGIADIGCRLARLGEIGDAAFRARHHRNTKLPGGQLGRDLVAHDADMFGTRADELDAMFGENVGKAGILREEAVAWVDGFSAGDLAGGDNGGNVEIAVAGRRRADTHALIRQAHMHCIGIGG